MPIADALKVVVRLLPPEITEEEFRATVHQQGLEGIKWWSFLAGKRYQGEAKPSLNARCYMQFETTAQAEEFISGYHGRAFVDGQGESFRAVACFAPYQKVPRTAQKDPRENTIDDDPVYKEFLEGLSEKKGFEAPPDPKASVRPAEPGDTPLLNFMKTRALERKARWEKKQSKKNWYALEAVEEKPKRAKWRCSECGTSKNLEEDPDNRGTFYCTYCWESWETAEEAAATKPAKKKKKKAKEEAVWEEVEEVEDTSSKKKKKKKGKDDVPKQEWRAKEPQSESWSEYAYDEEPTDSRRRKKKKNKEEAAAYEEESTTSRWHVKGHEEEWASQAWSEERGSSRHAKGKKDSKEAEWWAEPQEKASKSSRNKQDQWKEDEWWEDAREEKAPAKSSSRSDGRWRAKGAAEEEGGVWREEKPKKGKKDKGAEGESGGQWAPKSSSKASSYYW